MEAQSRSSFVLNNYNNNHILNSMQEISFDNIQNAFEYKSNAEINRAYWLFKVISNNTLVKLGPKFVDIAIKLHLPICIW